MNRKFTRLKVAAFALMFGAFQQASATFTPVAISAGFNNDVVANGIGTAASSTSAAFDNTAYALVAPDYQQTSVSALPGVNQCLPATGVINSVNTAGVTFNLASYTGNNSLRLTASTNGTITLANQTLIGDVYLLCGSGDAPAAGINANVVLNWVGGGSSTAFPITVNDWFNGSNFAIQGIGRVNRVSSFLDAANSVNPRLYEIKLTLPLSYYNKQIASITVTKTTASGVLNVMAVNVDHQACIPPVGLASSSITINSANLSWGAVTGVQGYEYAITTSATPPASGTFTTNTSYSASGLPAATQHWLHVRSQCGANSYSIWNSLSFTTLACPTVSGLSATGMTTVSANLSWNAVTGSLGYQYAVTTSSTPPASGTPTSATSYNATGLAVGTTHYLHVRSNCTGTSYSAWSTVSFATLACPSAGSPAISNNVPFSVDISWPGSTTAGVAGYNYVVTTSASAPTSSTPNVQFTTNTNATVTNLVPGTTYYAWVRTNCTATNAGWLNSGSFVNPYPPCYDPTNVTVSAISMHGAKFKWNGSIGTNPMGYQYAITTSATPPATGTTIYDTAYTENNLLANTSYYFHVRTLCGTSQYSHYSNWVSLPFATDPSCIAATGVSITNVTSSAANIHWNELAGIYGYEYFINQTPADPTVAGTPVNYNELAPLNLFSGTDYYFHLRVRCDTFNYSPWTTTPFTTQTICSAPSSPVVSNVTATGASFSWGSVSTAQNYEYAITTTPPAPVVGTPTTNTSYTANTLTPATTYYFHVRAYCSPSDISGWQSVSFTTNPITDVENIPVNDQFGVTVYPNPVRNKLVVEVKPHGKTNGTIQVVDMTGKMVAMVKTTSDKTEIDMSNLTPGIYLVKYFDEVNAEVIRVQKQ